MKNFRMYSLHNFNAKNISRSIKGAISRSITGDVVLGIQTKNFQLPKKFAQSFPKSGGVYFEAKTRGDFFNDALITFVESKKGERAICLLSMAEFASLDVFYNAKKSEE